MLASSQPSPDQDQTSGQERPQLDVVAGSQQDSPSQTSRFEDLHHSSLYWFSDGSVIIHGSDTLYLVHSSILAVQSPIFHDMMAIGTSSGDAHLDGRPIVDVSDPSEEWEELLGALYDPLYFAKKRETITETLTANVRLLCISTKYQCTAIRSQVISTLEYMFPTSFSSFAKHRTVVPLREALEIVAPLRRSNAVMFLPYILYEAATRAELDSLWNVPDCDLSMEDKAIIFCGILKLQNQLDETSLSFKSAVNLVYNRCSCRNYMQPTCAPYDETLLSGHTLDDRTGYINSRNSCRAHIDAFLGAHRRDRENAWRDLPAAFGLAPWDQLRAMQDVDRHAQDLPPSVPGQPSTA